MDDLNNEIRDNMDPRGLIAMIHRNEQAREQHTQPFRNMTMDEIAETLQRWMSVGERVEAALDDPDDQDNQDLLTLLSMGMLKSAEIAEGLARAAFEE